MNRFVIISGCSGGGKSTLLSELDRRGHGVVEEPGRRIVAEELAGTGDALPWVDTAAFARRAIAMSLRDREEAAKRRGWIFFDRGLIDAAAALEYATRTPVVVNYAAERFFRRVFITPPWREIYVNDADRRHTFQDAVAEYERLLTAFATLDYTVDVLPKIGVAERADIVLEHLRLT
ncbi:MAG: AAA family ATPase [Qipengyuania citrea]|jgi:predicted ATPase|uniref:AAA family ATPase n=1 Tax=Alphaproteobacteria TaxID=28211 RepID=UPI000C4C8628|nr:MULTISPECIES: AAA family ATPase [Erythrobacteraceae]MAL25734.1 ATPase [Croceicoccus sp.]MCD1589921.1 AAA family ATPase [Qipengyuania citrea]PNQ77773.1 ATPase [Erythrobacter sp. SAORIC-644]QPL39566.1 AAA family ATPase [Erythrobacter sp. A30-3]|tara:strand:- start:164 stop:694 length:531 start_codon:yes stop_codon:yes gene_type:complete